MLLFKYKNRMTPKVAPTGSTPRQMSGSLHNLPKNDTKILNTPENRTLLNFNPSPPPNTCLPKFRHVPPSRVLWPSHVYISTLVGLFISDFVKIKVIHQISVHLLCIPSLHYSAEIGLPCAGIT